MRTRWSKLGVQSTVRSVSQLLSEVASITVATGYRYVWRGVKDASYGLHSALERRLANAGENVNEANLQFHEGDLLRRAREARLHPELSPAELLALLQHAGASTPLLDVTPDPFVALFFATEPVGEIKPCALMAIRVPGGRGTLGESHTFHGPLPLDPRDVSVYERLQRELGISTASTDPLLWEAPFVDDRMRAQRGMFLATTAPPAGVDYGSFDLDLGARQEENRKRRHLIERSPGLYARPSIVVFYIAAAMRLQVARELDRRFGYRTETIYPDLAGFALANAPMNRPGSVGGWLVRRPPSRGSFP
jgi:hypothetical protein